MGELVNLVDIHIDKFMEIGSYVVYANGYCALKFDLDILSRLTCKEWHYEIAKIMESNNFPDSIGFILITNPVLFDFQYVHRVENEIRLSVGTNPLKDYRTLDRKKKYPIILHIFNSDVLTSLNKDLTIMILSFATDLRKDRLYKIYESFKKIVL